MNDASVSPKCEGRVSSVAIVADTLTYLLVAVLVVKYSWWKLISQKKHLNDIKRTKRYKQYFCFSIFCFGFLTLIRIRVRTGDTEGGCNDRFAWPKNFCAVRNRLKDARLHAGRPHQGLHQIAGRHRNCGSSVCWGPGWEETGSVFKRRCRQNKEGVLVRAMPRCSCARYQAQNCSQILRWTGDPSYWDRLQHVPVTP